LSDVRSNNNGSYQIVASNVMGVFTSAPIVLDVQYFAPTGYVFFAAGQSNAPAGSYVQLYGSIFAAPGGLSSQWQRNGTNIPGANMIYLELPNVSSNQSGLYRLIVNNSVGGFTTAPIALTVTYQAPTGSVYLSQGTLPAPAGSQVSFCASISGAPAPAL
jgi:hypothetical protein